MSKFRISGVSHSLKSYRGRPKPDFGEIGCPGRRRCRISAGRFGGCPRKFVTDKDVVNSAQFAKEGKPCITLNLN